MKSSMFRLFLLVSRLDILFSPDTKKARGRHGISTKKQRSQTTRLKERRNAFFRTRDRHKNSEEYEKSGNKYSSLGVVLTNKSTKKSLLTLQQRIRLVYPSLSLSLLSSVTTPIGRERAVFRSLPSSRSDWRAGQFINWHTRSAV